MKFSSFILFFSPTPNSYFFSPANHPPPLTIVFCIIYIPAKISNEFGWISTTKHLRFNWIHVWTHNNNELLGCSNQSQISNSMRDVIVCYQIKQPSKPRKVDWLIDFQIFISTKFWNRIITFFKSSDLNSSNISIWSISHRSQNFCLLLLSYYI